MNKTIISLIIIGLLCALVIANAEAAAEEPRMALARLLVATAPEEPVRVFERELGEAEQRVPETQHLQLSPMMYLFEADELALPQAASVVLLCYVDGTRQKHFGPCRLGIGPEGIEVLEPGDKKAVVIKLKKFDEPIWVIGRVDPRAAGTFVRDDPEKEPVVVYPADTAVLPGVVTFEWDYTGPAEGLVFSVFNQRGDELSRAEVVSDANGCRLFLQPGRTYYWLVNLPDASAQRLWKFEVLDEESLHAVKSASRLCGIADDRSILEGVGTLQSVDDLSFLLAVFQYYRLDKESEAAAIRLTAVLSEKEE